MGPVVAAIIEKEGEHGQLSYLLVQSKKDYGEYTGYWYPPGGKVEAGETDLEALHREIQEELGVPIIQAEYIIETRGDITDTITWWKCTVAVNDIHIRVSELVDARFFTKEQMAQLPLWPATKNFFETYIFGERI